MTTSTNPRTTIRMGAAHYDLTVKAAGKPDLVIDLKGAKRHEKEGIADQLVEAYGITGKKRSKKHHHTKHKGNNPHGNHKRRNEPAGQLPGEATTRQAEAHDGPKKRSRRRRAPRPVSAPGPAAA